MIDNTSNKQQMQMDDGTEENELSFGEVSPCRFDSSNYNNEKIDGVKGQIGAI